MTKPWILLLHCPDRKGLVAAIAQFLFERGGNILHAAQHQDNDLNLFFMRVEFALDDASERASLREQFGALAQRYGMEWELSNQEQLPKVAIFVSQYLHCLNDLLFRHHAGELQCEISLLISNHEDARPLADFYKIPFHHVPVTKETKLQAEERQTTLLRENGVELVVLARYMQVLSPGFCAAYPRRIINVHHSFLPAFTGAKPYHAAFARGVKLIGSSSHYVTEVLDEGPIIEQDVMRISHDDQLGDLIQKGRDLERLVLSRAVRWHLERRILSYANKTVIFN
ncbi:formyltetrahydrofolate deformylase [Granulicella sibirica]|uniref:Formyltetrahydrofolate deformylase n=1 Tax=Granulicella sibirica TaxID=2479048 RepID=A0A4V1L677_9BACT|nr:formyltetrahydrofolate deformylase [Granulicella sibirica]RXH58304.1 Formyltetrahydrofolate deformylase [Granulicella sibirica]